MYGYQDCGRKAAWNKIMAGKEYYLDLYQLLPNCVPAYIEKVLPGWKETKLNDGEIRLLDSEVKAVLVYAAYFGAVNFLLKSGSGLTEITNVLDASISNIDLIDENEILLSRKLISTFNNYHIIRENHPYDDWLCEAIWPLFQTSSYKYPSGISHIIWYGLNIQNIMEKIDITISN
jgi:hypothetical protein